MASDANTSGASQRLWAARITYRMTPLFGSSEERDYEERKFVEASNVDEAIIKAGRSCNALAIEHGITIQVVPVDWSKASRSTAKYDRPPMPEHGLVDRDAKVVWTHG